MNGYIETPIKASKKKDLKVISEMNTGAIIKHLLFKHRNGLVRFYALLITAYVIYDKIIKFFINGV